MIFKNIFIYSQKLGNTCIEEMKKFPLVCSKCFSDSKYRITFTLLIRKNHQRKSSMFNLKSHLCEKCFEELKRSFTTTKDLKNSTSGLDWDVEIDSYLKGGK